MDSSDLHTLLGGESATVLGAVEVRESRSSVSLRTLASTALGAGCVCAALQAAAVHSQRAARYIVALPVVIVALVYLAITNSESDHMCLARAREELQSYLAFSLISIVFVLVWLCCLEQATVRMASVRLGVCVSGACAMLVWFVCVSVLLLSVLA